MRLLRGTKLVEAAAAIPEGRNVIDLGAGDGRFAYESARADPGGFYIAVDSDADALSEYAFKASRKPARGGVDNASFVVAAVETLPAELKGQAGLVRVNFPWSGLLRGLVLPEASVLDAISSLATPAGRFEFVISYDPIHDSSGLGGAQLPPLSEAYVDQELRPSYQTAGLILDSNLRLDQDEAVSIPSTWGRRLLHGRKRDVFLLAGHCEKRPVASPDG